MSRYIDADALAEKFHKIGLGENSLIEKLFADGVYAIIDTFPAADAEPVLHAHWIKVFPRHIGRNATYKCSVCKKLRSSYYNDVAEWDHCPCGAKMDEKENK